MKDPIVFVIEYNHAQRPRAKLNSVLTTVFLLISALIHNKCAHIQNGMLNHTQHLDGPQLPAAELLGDTVLN